MLFAWSSLGPLASQDFSDLLAVEVEQTYSVQLRTVTVLPARARLDYEPISGLVV